MKLQEMHDYNFGSTTHQSKLFGRNLNKLKNLLFVIGFLIICSGLYYVGKTRVDQKMTNLEDQFNIMQNLLSDINSRINKGDVRIQSHVKKRNAEDGGEESSEENGEFVEVTYHNIDEDGLVRFNRTIFISHLESGIRYPGGATYIRWGSRNCDGPEHTKLVYEGIAAGSEYDNTGGGSNVICIDLNVSYTPGKYIDGNQGVSPIYGIEYSTRTAFNRLLDFSRTEGNSVYAFNIPCAVCMATGTVNQLMIPGRETCPPHWKKEYTGYILAGGKGHKSSKPYLCVDDTPEVVPGSDATISDGLFYIVETQCPSLQCEPFVHGRELRCVVCTI